jgi:DNA-binding response OmpR family regulator/signal transduction histidine kinase
LAHRGTLLFVDDEPDVLPLLSRLFEADFNVLTATSGPEALAIIREQQIDVLLTDQSMPKMTGIELVTAARAEGSDVTAILVTGHATPDELIAAINQGVHRYVIKPWEPNELRVTVRNAVAFTKLRREKDRLLSSLKKRVEALSMIYEVSRLSATGVPSYDAIIDRVLGAVARVLPYDCGAALISLSKDRIASLRLHCTGGVGEKGLLWVKETVLSAHRSDFGPTPSEDRLITRISGPVAENRESETFPSQLTVSLVSDGRAMGALSLFSRQVNAYSAEDGELLDALANQTADAIQSLRSAEDHARRRIELMVESMSDGVLLTDEKNEILVINPAARQLLRWSDSSDRSGRQLQEKLGLPPFELIRSPDYSGPKVIREELQLFERKVHCTATRVEDARGVLQGLVVVLRDITEQKQLEERKEEFLSIISHELRTPLTSISGALDLVLNFFPDGIDEKQQRYLLMAKDSTDKLNAVVDDLLDLSKFAQGRLRMNFEVGYLDELLQKALEKYGPNFIDKRIRLVPLIAASPGRILADPDRLNQVLNNLLTNAAKFAPAGGEIRVELRTSKSAPNYVCLSLWNSGETIPEADLERIFDKFEQARSHRNRRVRGTGLGLAICRSIVEAHGGRIWAEPAMGGARFVVALPLEPPPELLQGELPKPSERTFISHGGTVLVISGDPAFSYALKAILLAKPLRVFLAGSAEEALSQARGRRLDAIALDLGLPDVEGFRLAEILRNDPDTRHAPLLVIASPEERQRAFRLGANAFLHKPIAADKFVATVEALVRGRAGARSGRILVVDDDEKVGSICVEVLSNLGFEVLTARSLAEAQKTMRENRPDLLVMEVVLPDGDGLAFIENLKAERLSSHPSVIFLSARTEVSAKIRALKLGADDYLTKPFDALELGARVESVLRRRDQELGSSPTTQLPGSGAIEREVERRLDTRKPFAFCYLDLDNLKAYNDYYGFAKADGVIRQTGDLLREIILQEGAPGDFLGHVAGDDFVFITDPGSVDRISQRAIEVFDRIIPLYYDRRDRDRGYIEAEDRFGQRRKFPITSVSIVAVMCDGSSMDHSDLARIAAEMKKRAKAIPGSVYLRDDRDVVVPIAG